MRHAGYPRLADQATAQRRGVSEGPVGRLAREHPVDRPRRIHPGVEPEAAGAAERAISHGGVVFDPVGETVVPALGGARIAGNGTVDRGRAGRRIGFGDTYSNTQATNEGVSICGDGRVACCANDARVSSTCAARGRRRRGFTRRSNSSATGGVRELSTLPGERHGC